MENEIGTSEPTRYVYCVIPEDWKYVKIGRWKGFISSLLSRYTTCYGKFKIFVFQTEDAINAEKQLHLLSNSYRWRGELFEKSAVELFLIWCQRNTLDHVEGKDLQLWIESKKIRQAKQAELRAKRNSLNPKTLGDSDTKIVTSRVKKADVITEQLLEKMMSGVIDRMWQKFTEKSQNIADPNDSMTELIESECQGLPQRTLQEVRKQETFDRKEAQKSELSNCIVERFVQNHVVRTNVKTDYITRAEAYKLFFEKEVSEKSRKIRLGEKKFFIVLREILDESHFEEKVRYVTECKRARNSWIGYKFNV